MHCACPTCLYLSSFIWLEAPMLTVSRHDEHFSIITPCMQWYQMPAVHVPIQLLIRASSTTHFTLQLISLHAQVDIKLHFKQCLQYISLL